MNCNDVESVLGFGVSELSAEAVVHVESCPGCAEAHQRERAFQELLQLAATVQVEPTDRIWSRINARIQPSQPASVWDELTRRIGTLFQVPDLRPAWVTLVLALVVSGAVTGLRSRMDDDPALAELRNFEMDVPENPFLSEPGGNPNPFYSGGGQLQ